MVNALLDLAIPTSTVPAPAEATEVDATVTRHDPQRERPTS